MQMTQRDLMSALREVRDIHPEPFVRVRRDIRAKIKALANDVVLRADPVALVELIGEEGCAEVSVRLAGMETPVNGLEAALWDVFAESIADGLRPFVKAY